MQAVLKEILLYFIFLYLLYMVSYGSKDPFTNYFYRQAQNALEHGNSHTYGEMQHGPGYDFTTPLPMNKMRNMDSFWTWCRETYLPHVHSSVMYNGEPMPAGFTQDGNNYLRGTARLRQVRMHTRECPSAVFRYHSNCTPAYNEHYEDTHSFGESWHRLDSGEQPAPGFTYRNATEADGEGYYGLLNSYSGAGYTYSLGRTQQSAAAALNYLQFNNWIDRNTRAVFVEFTLFNQNLNLYTVSFIVHEFLPTGAFYPRFDIKLIRLDRYKGTHAIMVLIAEIGTLLYLTWFIVKEVKLMAKQRREYFKEFWNVTELLLLVVLCAATGMFFYRFYLLTELGKKLGDSTLQFVNFQRAAYYEETYLYLLGFIIFTATIKVLKLLRFNKKINSLGITMKYIAIPLISFLGTMMLVFMAFAQLSFFVYNTLLLEFNSFIESCLTLFTLMLNKFDYTSMQQANPVFAPIIFFSFTVVIGFGLISFMMTLILEGFSVIRHDLASKPNQYEIVDFLIGKFKAFAGWGADQLPDMNKKEKLIQDWQAQLNTRVGELSERLLELCIESSDDIRVVKKAEDRLTLERKRRALQRRILLS